MRKQCYFFLLLGLILTGCNRKANEFTVLQWNIWRERCPNVLDIRDSLILPTIRLSLRVKLPGLPKLTSGKGSMMYGTKGSIVRS